MSEVKFLDKDQVEAIVRGDLEKKYPGMKKFEFRTVEPYNQFKEWWLTGHFFTSDDNLRGFFYRLDAKTGEIKAYRTYL